MTVAVEPKIGFPEAAAPQAGVVLAKAAGTESFRAGWESLLAALGGGTPELAAGPEALAQGKLAAEAMGKGAHGSGTGMASMTGDTWPMLAKGQFARQNLRVSQLPQTAAGEPGLAQSLPDAIQRAGALAGSNAAIAPDAAAAAGQATADPLKSTGAQKTRADRSASGTASPAARRKERGGNAQSAAAIMAAATQAYVPPAPIEALKTRGTGENKEGVDGNPVASRVRQELESLAPGGKTQKASGVGQIAAMQTAPGFAGTSAGIGPAEGDKDQPAGISEERPAAADPPSVSRQSSLRAVQGLESVQEAPVGGKGMPVSMTVPESQGRSAESNVSDLRSHPGARTGDSAAADVTVATSIAASAQTHRGEGTRNVARTGGTEPAGTPGKPTQNVAEPVGRKDQTVSSAPLGKVKNSAAATQPDKPASTESPAKQRDVTDRAIHASSVWSGSHPQEARLAAFQPAAQPVLYAHPAQAQSGVAAASGQGSPVSAAAAGTGRTNPDAFSTLDAAAAPTATWSQGTAHRAEAGFQDPSLGWVSVRAEAGTSGIHASVVASSTDAAQVLSGHTTSLAAHLAERHTPVETLTFSSSGGQSSGAGADRGANQNMQQNGGQAPHPGQRAQAASGSVAEARAAPHFAEEAVRTPVGDFGFGGGRISVVA